MTNNNLAKLTDWKYKTAEEVKRNWKPAHEIFDDSATNDFDEFLGRLGNYPKYNTGKTFNALDEYLIIRDGLITVGGKHSTGKTSFSFNLGITLLQEIPDTCFFIYSINDSGNMSLLRINSILLNKNTFLTGEPSKDTVMDRIFLFENMQIEGIEEDVRYGIELLERDSDIKYKPIICIDCIQSIHGGDLNNDVHKLLSLLRKLEHQYGGCILICNSWIDEEVTGACNHLRTNDLGCASDVCIEITWDGLGNERIINITKNRIDASGAKFKTELLDSFRFSQLTKII